MAANDPIQATLLANDGTDAIYITSDTSMNVLNLTLKNTTTGSIRFQQSNTQNAAIGALPSSQSGVYLLFNGLLPGDVTSAITVTSPGWTLQRLSDDRNGPYLVLLPAADVTLAAGASLVFTLQLPAVSTSTDSGYITCQYVNVVTNTPVTGGDQLYVSLVYPPRQPDQAPVLLPIQFEFVGDDFVYVGDSPKTLHFRITNTGSEALVLNGMGAGTSGPPEFELHLLVDDGNNPGALFNSVQASAASVSIDEMYGNHWKIPQRDGSDPGVWILRPDPGYGDTVLGTNKSASVAFTINNISLSAQQALGTTMVALKYRKFPGYPDGQFLAPVQKLSKPAPPPEPPVIRSFSATKYSVNIAQPMTTVNYTVENAASITLRYCGQTLTANSSSADITPAYTTLVTLTATNTVGAVSQDILIAVDMIPLGTIAIWSGPYNSIPTGWHLCDGATYSGQRTPDLRNRFVFGAQQDGQNSGDNRVVYLNEKSGSWDHTHSAYLNGYNATTQNAGSHTHSIDFNGTKNVKDNDGNKNNNTYFHGNGSTIWSTENDGNHNHNLTIPGQNVPISTTSSLPPFYGLYYIMKCS